MARICAEGLRIEFPLYHLGARSMKKRQIGAIAGTVVGMLVWGFLHRIIWRHVLNYVVTKIDRI
jgi:hypothetical protein